MGERLKGKVAVVTGASRGMGLGISKAFAYEGAQVAMLARGAGQLRDAAANIPNASAFTCDVADPDAVRATFEAVEAEFGGIDILINNAGWASPQLLEKAEDRLVQIEVGVNLLGPLYCMRSAIAAMRRRGGGDIINVSSESVMSRYPYLSFYAATKSALETLTAAARGELKGSNIRVTLYRSGRVQSSFHHHWDPEVSATVRELAVVEGFVENSGGSIAADIPGKAMVDLMLLDRSAHIDIIQLRGV
jgi:meso-butanediol dehydrogenase / (S,S)-butanediol dehydrogenase / diacetyl reductase